MTAEEKTLLAILTLAAVLVPVAFGTVLGWPVWSWLLLAAPLLSILGLVTRNILRRVQQEPLQPPHAAPPVRLEQQDQALVPEVTLRSALDDYPFHFSATVHWRTRGSKKQHTNPGALAKNAIIARAKTLTAAEHPNEIGVVQHRLASELAAVQPLASGGVEAWADNVQLTLSEADQEQLRKLSDLRKDDDLGERELNHERRKRDYLRDEVFTSTGSAVTWRLAQKDNDVEDTVRLIGELAQLSVAVNDREVVPGLLRHLLPTPARSEPASLGNGSCLDGSHPTIRCPLVGLPAGPFSGVSPVALGYRALMDAAGFDDNPPVLLASRIAWLFDKFEKPDAAQEIQRCFVAPATDVEPAGHPTPDGELPDKPVPDGQVPRQEVPWRNPPLPTGSEQDGQPQTDEHLASEQLEKPYD